MEPYHCFSDGRVPRRGHNQIARESAAAATVTACPRVRLRSSRVRVSVKGWCPIGFPIALDGGNLCLEIILGRRAPKWGAPHIDSIVLTF